MSPMRQRCFFALPFSEELNFFYLYLKQHIEANYFLEVERGDTTRLTGPVQQKVNDQIQRSRLIIADITGDNPNVMYEVGLAHAKGKPVLFLTQDPPDRAPFDLRHFDLISYELGDEVGLLDQLDRALREELAEQFADLYERACALLGELNASSRAPLPAVPRDVFHQRIGPVLGSRRMPPEEDEVAMAELLLPRIVQDSTDMRVIRTLATWMGERFE